jgi:hypothetical protein
VNGEIKYQHFEMLIIKILKDPGLAGYGRVKILRRVENIFKDTIIIILLYFFFFIS